MGGKWSMFGLQLHKVLWVVLTFHLQAHECLPLNLEGRALLRLRENVEGNPYGAFENWDSWDVNPCNWSGVRCIDGKVETLNLKGLSLKGTLAPELGNLSHLRSLVLYKNNFSGTIPKDIANLAMLELLDLRDNNFSGTIPVEIGEMLYLKHLLLCGNNFQGTIPSIKKLGMHSERKCDQYHSLDADSEIICINRKVGHCIWQRGLQQLKKIDSFSIPIKPKILHYFDMLHLFKFKRYSSLYAHREKIGDNRPSSTVEQNLHAENSFRRKLLQELTNLPAAPVSGAIPQEVVDIPSIASGSFPAVPTSNSVNNKEESLEPILTNSGTTPHNYLHSKPTNKKEDETSASETVGKWLFALILPGIALLAIAASMMACRRQSVVTIAPWKTGLSGQLQKAFVTGVPKLNRSELEAACEDFSNIVVTLPTCTIFKGILSSGVEIAVVSTCITSAKDWSKRSEVCFRRKIDTLSRVNHKNYANLLGYCEENEPFMRMMVYEYSPNGRLSEHLHLEEFESLDWSARMRIIMGIAYCLRYMHHDLNPPVTLPFLKSSDVFLTDDYATKIADTGIWKEVAKGKISGDDEKDPSESSFVDPGNIVYSFGILMIEIISGKCPEEEGSLLNWATEHLKEKNKIKNLVDPTLNSFKDEELDVLVEVIQACTHQDPKNQPTMIEVTSKLREVIGISPEAASPRLSPLWWAELEILSAS